MLRIKSLFSDARGLHARIDTLARGPSVARITLVSSVPRARSKPLLEALVADPIDDSSWFPQLLNRPLSKDILVSQADSFEFIQTRNSLTEFPVPFSGQNVEILEVSPDSKEHIETADLLVRYGEGGTGGGATGSGYDLPTVHVLDDPLNPPRVDGDRFRVNLAESARGDSLLRQSPQNISQYLEAHQHSGLEPLKQRIFRPVDSLRRDLAASVVETCRSIIAEGTQQLADSSKVSERAQALRSTWTREAHRELQLLLGQYDRVLASKLAWYALYYRVDDVETVLSSVPVMPQSRTSLEYASGQIDALVQAPHSVRPSIALDLLAANIRNAATRLHNTGIKALSVVVLGLQLPIAAVAAAGVYSGQFSVYSMGGLAALGLVIGFRRLQNRWIAASKQFLQSVDADVQAAIAQSETALWSIYEEKRKNQESHLEQQRSAVAELEAQVASKPEARTHAQAQVRAHA